MRRREIGDRVGAELRPAGMAADALEEADEVHAVAPVDGRAVIRAGGSRPRDRQLRIDVRQVHDRLRLQIENVRILTEVRDLDHAAASGAVVDQERLIALAPEVAGGPLDTEEPGSNV